MAMKNTAFGAIIADARRDIGITQAELVSRIANLLTKDGRKVGISYLSKIECSRMGPPSVPVLKAMAMALGLDEDDLLAAAGRAPSDIGSMLKTSPGARRFFRKAVTRAPSEKRWDQLIANLDREDPVYRH